MVAWSAHTGSGRPARSPRRHAVDQPTCRDGNVPYASGTLGWAWATSQPGVKPTTRVLKKASFARKNNARSPQCPLVLKADIEQKRKGDKAAMKRLTKMSDCAAGGAQSAPGCDASPTVSGQVS